MKSTSLHLATAAALAATLLMTACKKDEPVVVAPAPSVEPAPAPAPTPPPAAAATATITQIQLGKPASPGGPVGTEAMIFAPADTITASVGTVTSDPAASVSGTLSATWAFEDGQVVNQESKSFVFVGPGTTNFEISKPDGWPAGRYTLSVSLDGQAPLTREFRVQ